MQPLIGYNYGAQNYRRLRQVLRFSYQFTIGLGLVLTVIVFAAAPLLIRLFMQDGSVYDLGLPCCGGCCWAPHFMPLPW